MVCCPTLPSSRSPALTGLGGIVHGPVLSSAHRFSMGLRSGDWLGHSSRLMLWSPNHTLMTLAVCLGSLSCWKTKPRHKRSCRADWRRFSSRGPPLHGRKIFENLLKKAQFQTIFRLSHGCSNTFARKCKFINTHAGQQNYFSEILN